MSKKRCGQCERFAWNPSRKLFGCSAKHGYWSSKTAMTMACGAIRLREYLDPRNDPDPLPKDGEELEQIRESMEDALL